MKKIIHTILILAIVSAIAMPAISSAAWRSDEALLNRVADLEAKVQQLQSQTTTTSCACPSVADLENRVTVLEKTVNLIIGQVSQTLTQILKYITK
jgi:hypothetical protein